MTEAFEAWLRTTYQPGADNSAWAAWQAAILAERERCAKVCEELAGAFYLSVHSNWNDAVAACAEDIRNG